MFGYIRIHEQELRVREVSLYRSYYCGLCEDLFETYGRAGQMTLSYDTTFLGFLLSCLYEPSDERRTQTVCLTHPFRRHPMRRSRYTQYAADMTILLAYYAGLDNWQDEHSVKGLALSGILQGAFKKASKRHPEKAAVIKDCLDRLHEIENRAKPFGKAGGQKTDDFKKSGQKTDGPNGSGQEAGGQKKVPGQETDGQKTDGQKTAAQRGPGRNESIQKSRENAFPNKNTSGDGALADEAGSCFGALMAELFVFEKDIWEESLRRMGFFLGKYIYLLDAYDDLDKDAASGSFNPLLPVRGRMQERGEDFDSYVRDLLTMCMASCSRAFEALPIVENADILRNILYAGVWIRFEEIRSLRAGNTAGADEDSSKQDGSM